MILRFIASILTAASLLCPSSFAFDSPLSDQAVREAYFLGQRHDASFLGDSVKTLLLPKTGPHIAVITLLTPFAQLAQYSSSYIGSYSAQQAVLDHRGQKELVKITVEIRFTGSYGATIPNPSSSPSKSSPAFIPRPSDFWKDFSVEVSNGNLLLSPSDSAGHPLYRGCGRTGRCGPMGAVLQLEFPPAAFSADTITIRVTPPEGDPVSVDFYPSRLR
jgi:hypothetical protein